MGVISKIRKRSSLIVTLIGIAILGFVLQDMMRNNNQQAPPLADIDGEVISYNVFNATVEDFANRYRQAQGEEIDLTPEDMEQVRMMAWTSTLNDILLAKACDDVGLKITLAEMNDMYYGKFINPILRNYFNNPNTGEYDRQQVMNLINTFDQYPEQDRTTLLNIERVVKTERMKEKYYMMANKAYYVPSLIAQRYAEEQSNNVESKFVSLDYVDVDDKDVEITEEDYRKYYNKNKYLFEQNASRAIEYVVFDIEPTHSDILEIENEANALYEEFRVEENVQDFVNAVSTIRFDSIYMNESDVYPGWSVDFFAAEPGAYFAPRRVGSTYQMGKLMDIQMRPDSIRASHILVAYKETGSQSGRSKEEAKYLADSILGLAMANPSNFITLAASFSEDPSAAQNGGDITWQKEGFLLKPLNEAIVASKIGDVKLVETQAGYHILKVTGKTPNVKKVLACVVSVPLEASGATIKQLYTDANRLVAESRNMVGLDTVSKKHGYRLRVSEYTDELSAQLPGVNGAREIVRWAYEEGVKEGELAQKVFELGDKYVVAGLREIREEGYTPFERAKENPQITAMVRRGKKAEKLLAKIKASTATDLQTLATELSLEVNDVPSTTFMSYSYGTKGYEPELVGRLFGMPVNTLSKPIEGASGVYIIEVTKKDTPEISPDQINRMRTQKQMANENSITTKVNGAIEEMSEIEDNRHFYY